MILNRYIRAKSDNREAAAGSGRRPKRFVAKGLKTLRMRLGLSGAAPARLLGVSKQTVFTWETRRAIPRKEMIAAIFALRGIGEREAQDRLEALKKPAIKKLAPATLGKTAKSRKKRLR